MLFIRPNDVHSKHRCSNPKHRCSNVSLLAVLEAMGKAGVET
jgi:hypothetical protein